MKKALVIVTAIIFSLAITGSVLAAEKGTAGAAPKAAAPAVKNLRMMPPKAGPGMPPGMRPNFVMLFGKISKVDTTDPANVKVEVVNESDNKTHTIEVISSTNVTKVVDPSELKTGDMVRVMARKVDNKEVAMGVMFGKIKRPVVPGKAMMPPPPAPAAAPEMKETVKK